jgi:hypothetical protein
LIVLEPEFAMFSFGGDERTGRVVGVGHVAAALGSAIVQGDAIGSFGSLDVQCAATAPQPDRGRPR